MEFHSLDHLEFPEEISEIEDQKFHFNLKTFGDEIINYRRVKALYNNLLDSKPQHMKLDTQVAYFLFVASKNDLTLSLMDLLRDHIFKAIGTTRNPIESSIYTYLILKENSEETRIHRARVWMNQHPDPESFKDTFQRKIESVLKESQFSNFYPYYRWSCYGSHPSMLSSTSRINIFDNVAKGSYFDNVPPELGGPTVLSMILVVHLEALKLYRELFRGKMILKNPSVWEENISATEVAVTNRLKGLKPI